MSGIRLFRISLAVALVQFISLPARAELFKNLKTEASIETRSFSISNETDRNSSADDYRSATYSRLMIGANFDLLDDVHGRFLLDRSPEFGNGAPSVQNIQDSLLFDNGYVKIDKVFGHIDLTIGRQFYNDASDLVFYAGPQGDEILSVTSLDAFRADADILGVVKFHGLVSKLNDRDSGGTFPTGPDNNADTNVWGGEFNSDKLIPSGNIAAYYYTRQIKKAFNTVNGNDTLSVTGVRVNGDVPPIGGLGYQAEYIQNLGRDHGTANAPAHNGNAYFLGVNYGRTMNTTPIRAHLEYGRGSDDFTTIAAGRRFGLIWGEHTSLTNAPSNLNRTNGVGQGNSGAGLSNLKVVDAGVGFTCPKTHIGVDLTWYRFIYAANIGNIGTSAGTEYDLVLSYKHSDNVSFEVNAATFQVGDALKNTGGTPTNPITRLGADVKIKY